MVQMIPLKCPKCGADLEIKEGTKICYCSYCGTKIVVDDTVSSVGNMDNRKDSHDSYSFDNKQYTVIQENNNSAIGSIIRHIEEKQQARKEEEERERLEAERRQREAEEKAEARKKAVINQLFGKEHQHRNLIILGIIAVLILIACIYSAIKKATYVEADHTGQLQIPASAYELKNQNYQDVKKQFETSGFTNINLEPEGDLITGWITDPDSVDSVSINGFTDYGKGDWFSADAEIVIRYHSFTKDEESDEAGTVISSVSTEDSSDGNSIATFEVDDSVSLPKAPKGDKNGFDEATNFNLELNGLSFSIPSYYVVWNDKDGGFQKGYYVDGSDGCDIRFYTKHVDNTITDRDELNSALDSQFKDELIKMRDAIDDAKIIDYHNVDGIEGMLCKTSVIVYNEGYSKTYLLYDLSSSTLFIIQLDSYSSVEYSYVSDFDKIVMSVKPVAQKTSDSATSSESGNKKDKSNQAKKTSEAASQAISVAPTKTKTHRSKVTGLEYALSVASIGKAASNYYLFDTKDHLITYFTTTDNYAINWRYEGALSSDLIIHCYDGGSDYWDEHMSYPDKNDHSMIKLYDTNNFDWDYYKVDLDEAIAELDKLDGVNNWY